MHLCDFVRLPQAGCLTFIRIRHWTIGLASQKVPHFPCPCAEVWLAYGGSLTVVRFKTGSMCFMAQRPATEPRAIIFDIILTPPSANPTPKCAKCLSTVNTGRPHRMATAAISAPVSGI